MKKKEIYWTTFYHGTTKANAEIIKKNGFKRGAFFAAHLEDSVKFGGEYVFQVSIKLPYSHTYWEYVSANKVRADQIVRLTIFTKKELFNNPKLGDRIFKFNLKKTLGPRYRTHMAKCGAINRYRKNKQ